MKMTHHNRPAPQYAYSDRDVAWLEKNGWAREAPVEVKPAESTADAAAKPKRGRPFKVTE